MGRRVILDTTALIDYERGTAIHHARLLAHTRRAGLPRGAHDLIIAAHAAQSERILLSPDTAARFGDLPGVVAESL